VATLDVMLARHGDVLRKGRSSRRGGAASAELCEGDARAIIAREHDFENWDQFAAFAEAMKDARSTIAQFEAAVDAIVGGDIATLGGCCARTRPSFTHARRASIIRRCSTTSARTAWKDSASERRNTS